MKKDQKNLNRQDANFDVLYTKLHHYHWLVEGVYFQPHHALFEKFYYEVTEHFNEVAERIFMISGKSVATLKEFFELSTVKEPTSKETVRKMFSNQ